MYLRSVITIYITCMVIHTTLKSQVSLTKLFASVDYVVPRRILLIIEKKKYPASGKGSTQEA